MYNTKAIEDGLPYLISTINNAIKPLFVSECVVGKGRFEWNRLFIRLNNMDYGAYAFSITEKGDLYDPILNGPILSITFDWINRIGYDLDRQVKRVRHYKTELIERVWHPSNLENLIY